MKLLKNLRGFYNEYFHQNLSLINNHYTQATLLNTETRENPDNAINSLLDCE